MPGKLFVTRSRRRPRMVLEAVVLLGSDLPEEEVVARLVQCGGNEAVAWKLVVLVPMAFVRVAFEPAGVRFCAHYLLLERSGWVVSARRRLLNRDPLYREAVRWAQRLGDNRRVEAFYQIARRGAEFSAVERRWRNGWRLQDIRIDRPGVVAN